jgi:hypothetical protein
VIAYSEPGDSDLNVIREKIHKADALFAVDQDLQREREFTDYPYTVDSYFITVKTKDQYLAVTDCAYRFPKIKIIIVPIENVRLKSFFEMTYSKPLWKDSPTHTFWIGDSETLDLPNDFSQANLEDPTTYVRTLDGCRDLSLNCFDHLIESGYLKEQSLLDGQTVIKPLEYLNGEIANTLTLISQGFNGTPSLGSVLNSTYDKTIIKNITLHHELWTSAGESIPPEALLKVAGKDLRPIGARTKNGGYNYMLPIAVSPSDISPRVRNTTNDLGVFLSQMQKKIISISGMADL